MLDLTKPVQTRDGREVEIYREDGGGCGGFIFGAFKMHGTWRLMAWEMGSGRAWNMEEWRSGGPVGEDLINVPEKRLYERWVNVYEDGSTGNDHSSRARADASAWLAAKTRTECLHIRHEYEPGEGL